MKTYLLNLTKEIKSWSKTLDVTAIICSKSWLVFNEEGKKEVFIFKKDGSLIVSVVGKVMKASWEYIPVNSSLIITTANNESFMLNPVLYDDKVFTMQLDGTKEFAFLIDQQYVETLNLKSLVEVDTYINHHDQFEQQQIDEKKRKKEEKEQIKNAKQKAREEWNKEIDLKLEEWKKTPEYEQVTSSKYLYKWCGISVGSVLSLSSLFLLFLGIEDLYLISSILLPLGVVVVLFCELLFDVSPIIGNKREEIVKEHPFVYRE